MGLLGSLLRGLAMRRPGSGVAVERLSPQAAEAIRRAEAALSRVVIPGYDVDIVSGGLVRRIRVSHDGSRVLVALDYTGSDPGCNFCRFISRTAWRKIVEETRRALSEAGFSEVIVVDHATGLPIES